MNKKPKIRTNAEERRSVLAEETANCASATTEADGLGLKIPDEPALAADWLAAATDAAAD